MTVTTQTKNESSTYPENLRHHMVTHFWFADRYHTVIIPVVMYVYRYHARPNFPLLLIDGQQHC